MPHASKFHRTISGIGALVALLVLSAGVPGALWALAGWPLPAGVPSVSEVTSALTRSEIPDAALLKAVALAGWIAWAHAVVSLAVELAAWARGRPAPRLRGAGTIQLAVRRLIATAALLAGSAQVSPSLAAMPARAAHVASAPLAEQPPPATAPGARQFPAGLSVTPVATAPVKSHTVVRYDTLWALAETHLGDPFRWREIYELNRGVPQPDGRSLQDPDLIIPGWVLVFPADAVGLPETRPPGSATGAASEQDQQADDGEPPPGCAAPATTSTSVPSGGNAPAVTTAASTTDHQSSTAGGHPEEDQTSEGTDPALLIGGGLAAAGLVLLLDRLRRSQRRRRRSRAQPLRPEVDQAERRLRAAADLAEAEQLDLALRAFARGSHDRRSTPPPVLAVRVGGGRVELLTERPPDRTPEGFVATDSGRGWITEPDLGAEELAALGSHAPAPLPALVTIGGLEGGTLLIDLETAGMLTVSGDGDRASAFVRRIQHELATSIWADYVDVLVVGHTVLDIAGAERVREVADFDAALDELAAVGRDIGAALDASGCGSSLAARFADASDGWAPTILVCTEPIDENALARLTEITGSGSRGVGAVVASTERARWHAHLDDAGLVLEPFGFRVAPGLLDDETEQALGELLADAADRGDGDGDSETEDPEEAAAEALAPPPTAEPYADPPFEVEVRVLGPVEIAGAAGEFDRRRYLELATYLALHPKGVSDERLKTVLWPNGVPTTATFNTAVSTTRSRLGNASDGSPHFPHFTSNGGIYQLGPLVTTDLARFEARVAHARRCAPALAIETLCSALDLVRGKPFEGAQGFEWAFSEGIISNIEATIADAAHRLAELCLAAGDHQGANAAAVKGLIAAPGDEILYRDRMLACHLAGNPAAVEAVMDELCGVVEALEPYDELHPETLALYDRISHRKRRRAG